MFELVIYSRCKQLQGRESLMTKEEVQMLGFEIVAYAGDARSTLLEAFEKMATKDFAQANELKVKADELLNKAHSRQVEMLQQEAMGESSPYSFIMIHGQDHLMTTMLLRDMYATIETIYSQIG